MMYQTQVPCGGGGRPSGSGGASLLSSHPMPYSSSGRQPTSGPSVSDVHLYWCTSASQSNDIYIHLYPFIST